jgi:hypothetical protein
VEEGAGKRRQSGAEKRRKGEEDERDGGILECLSDLASMLLESLLHHSNHNCNCHVGLRKSLDTHWRCS